MITAPDTGPAGMGSPSNVAGNGSDSTGAATEAGMAASNSGAGSQARSSVAGSGSCVRSIRAVTARNASMSGTYNRLMRPKTVAITATPSRTSATTIAVGLDERNTTTAAAAVAATATSIAGG